MAGGAAARARSSSTTSIEICHGSPFDEDAYIFDELDAVRALKASTRPLCLFGHTHYPVDVRARRRTRRHASAPADAAEMRIALQDGSKYLVNPGSVGQPRDGDPRAAYAIVDTERDAVELFRRGLSGRRRAGEDHQGRTARGAGAAARGRAIAAD